MDITKIKEITISKSLKQTVASKNELGLTNYNSIEPSMSLTASNPTQKDIDEMEDFINIRLVNQLGTDPHCLEDNNRQKQLEINTTKGVGQ